MDSPAIGTASKKTSPLRYAIGMFGTSIPINMFKTFAVVLYVDTLGVTAEQFALVVFLYTFLDALDNPVYGFLSDRTRTRWGRRRPWLVIGAPLLVLSFVLFFNPITLAGPNVLFIHLLLTYMLTGTLDSLINASYGALFPELFRTEAERTKTNAIRQAFQLAAMIIGVALTPIVANALGYALTSVVYGVLALAVIWFCALGCHEANPEEIREKPKLFPSLKAILTNPKFWIFGAANAFYSAAFALVMPSLPLFVKYALHLGSRESTILLATALLFAMVGVLIWGKLIKRFTLMPAWRYALMFLALAFVPLYFTRGLVDSILATVLVGLGLAGVMVTMDMVGARIMDEDTQRYGVRREGLYSSVSGFMNRLSGLFVSLAYVLVKPLYGYVSGDVPGPQPDAAMRFLLILFPFAAMLLSVLASRFLHFPAHTGAAIPTGTKTPAPEEGAHDA